MMTKVKKIRIIVCEPNELPRVETVEPCLETWQKLVDGLIQVIYPFDDDACVILNDEGKLKGLAGNRPLADENGVIYDVMVGTFVIVRAPEDSDDFDSLTDEQVEKYMAKYSAPLTDAEYEALAYYEELPPWDRID